MVALTNIVVDIGTDHGYIPIHLMKNNFCKKVIATDISFASLEKARRNIKIEGLSKDIELRKGNGFSVLARGEANVAIVSGMGGNLIRDILLENMEITKEFSSLILQPVQNPEILREFLFNYGFIIIDEDLCIDDGKYYEIIKVRFQGIKDKNTETFYEISQMLLKNKHPLMDAYIKYKIDKYNKILSEIILGTESSRVRIIEVKSKIKKLRELLDCLF